MPVPTTTDLTTYLAAMDLVPAAGINEQGIIDGAIETFQQITGRVNYQGATTATENRFTLDYPFGRDVVLDFRFDFWAITEVRVGYTGVSGSGQVLTDWVDFEYLPQNNLVRGWPYEAIRFHSYASSERGSVLITGKIGVAQEMPQDVFNAILAYSAAMVIRQSAGVSGSVSEQKQGDRTVKYNMTDGKDTVSELMKEFNQVATKWKRGGYQ